MATVDAADALDRSLKITEEETQMTVVAEEEDFPTASR
jgi:hypothetical protein